MYTQGFSEQFYNFPFHPLKSVYCGGLSQHALLLNVLNYYLVNDVVWMCSSRAFADWYYSKWYSKIIGLNIQSVKKKVTYNKILS